MLHWRIVIFKHSGNGGVNQDRLVSRKQFYTTQISNLKTQSLKVWRKILKKLWEKLLFSFFSFDKPISAALLNFTYFWSRFRLHIFEELRLKLKMIFTTSSSASSLFSFATSRRMNKLSIAESFHHRCMQFQHSFNVTSDMKTQSERISVEGAMGADFRTLSIFIFIAEHFRPSFIIFEADLAQMMWEGNRSSCFGWKEKFLFAQTNEDSKSEEGMKCEISWNRTINTNIFTSNCILMYLRK